MTDEQLSSISNGIWMCYRHGKLIDTDEVTYTIPMLKAWRELAELKARLWHQIGWEREICARDLETVSLPVCKIPIDALGAENLSIGEALRNCCVAEVWGRALTFAIRDAAIELVRNAMTHGGAANATLRIEPNFIEIVDDGKPFNSHELVSLEALKGGGGSLSLSILDTDFRDQVIFASGNSGNSNVNRFTVLRATRDFEAFAPCTVHLDDVWPDEFEASIKAIACCDTIYLLLPDHMGLSDASATSRLIAEVIPSGKRCVVVGSIDFSDRVKAHFRSCKAATRCIFL